MEKDVVIINNITKQLDGHVVLNNISLTLKEGHIYGLVGENGSGKSMLLKAMCGLLHIDSGTIEVFGVKLNNKNFPPDVGALLDAPGLLSQYSIFKNLNILASINNKVNDEDIKKAISMVGLDYNDNRPIKKYSLGMKQKGNIAQAIMEKPRLLLLDEPMNSLDAKSVEAIRNLIFKLKEDKVTIVITSHNEQDINLLCDDIFIIDNGSIVQKQVL